ncbi:MAG: hypothetical protein EXS51_03640 [Candidatus Taylorbacteria bacterium]|nr:hypothetical protein [Candidatus Taylorbacteria bacterium]
MLQSSAIIKETRLVSVALYERLRKAYRCNAIKAKTEKVMVRPNEATASQWYFWRVPIDRALREKRAAVFRKKIPKPPKMVLNAKQMSEKNGIIFCIGCKVLSFILSRHAQSARKG